MFYIKKKLKVLILYILELLKYTFYKYKEKVTYITIIRGLEASIAK